MRLSIRHKVALLLCSFSLLLIGTMFIAAKMSFSHGFVQYLNTILYQKAQSAVQFLEQQYPEPQQWQALLQSRREWHQFRRQIHSQIVSPDVEPPPDERHPPMHGHPMPPVWLLDADKRIVHGRGVPIEQLHLFPIHDPLHQVKGYLAVRPIQTLFDQADRMFVQLQNRWFIGIALASLLFSSVLAWPLSAWLVRPIQRLSKAMGRLTQRDYQARVAVQSDDELGRLARDFNHMAAAVAQYDNAQRQWLADAAHELRTPLAVLKGEMEALQDGIRPFNRAQLDSLAQEVDHLHRLVEDLQQLSLADLGALRYQFAPVDCQALLEQVLVPFQQQWQQSGIVCDIATQGTVQPIQADANRLQQLFLNLAQNSTRYTDAPGQIQIQWIYHAQQVELIWQDSAPGVSEADSAKLLQRFYRLESSRNRALGGSGLGLAIVHSIVQAHQGQIRLMPSALGGLCIVIELPKECHHDTTDPHR